MSERTRTIDVGEGSGVLAVEVARLRGSVDTYVAELRGGTDRLADRLDRVEGLLERHDRTLERLASQATEHEATSEQRRRWLAAAAAAGSLLGSIATAAVPLIARALDSLTTAS